MSIDIPKRRPLSLFDDPDLDERYAREMERYRAAIGTGQPYSPGSALAAALFGAGEASPRDSAAADLMPPVEKDNALPELLPEARGASARRGGGR